MPGPGGAASAADCPVSPQLETKPRTSPRFALALLAAVALSFVVDALVFRGGFYRGYIDPESYAGQADLRIRECVAATPSRNNVLLLGDSRIGEGFSAKLANSAGARLHFVNGSVSASTPRCWFYLLRAMDPARSRFGTVILPVDDYDDEDGASEWADVTLDTRIVIFCLRFGDVWDYANSFHAARARFEAWRAALWKGFIIKDDVRAFLASPEQRLRKVRQYAENGVGWAYDYQGRDGFVNPEDARRVLSRPVSPQTGKYSEYRHLWFGRIIDAYRGTPVRFVFIRIPAHPLRRPHPPIRFPRTIPEFASPNVTVLDENAFTSLERPDLFFDTEHLNATGRKRFTAMLARKVSDAVPLP